MKINYVLISSLFIFLLSCSTDNTSLSKIKLSDANKIYAKKINIPVDIYRPSKLYVYKNKLIVFDNIDKEIFKVFTLPNLNFSYSFGSIGPGPKEFSSLSKESINISKYFEILDGRRLLYYEFNDTIAEQKEKQQLIITKVLPINNFRKLSDSIYIYNNDDFSEKNNFELMSLNLNTKDEKEFGDSHDWSEELKDEEIYQMRSKSICHSEHNKRTAVFYYHRPMFKIYSDSNVLLNTVIVEDDKKLNVLDKFGYNKDLIYFTESFATEKYVYVMWVNKNKQEIGKNIENFSPTLLVFNWNGDLVNQYVMDMPVITFAVSEIENKLYATSFLENDINAIYEYDLHSSTKKVVSNIVKNEFYSLEMIKNYSFVAKDETEINQIVPYGQYHVNCNYFSQGKERVDTNLESIRILYYETENLKLEKEIEALLKLNHHEGTKRNINVNDTNVLQVSFRTDSKDYYEKIHTLYHNVFYFELSNKIIQIDISANTENIDEYYNDFLSMISSFSVLN